MSSSLILKEKRHLLSLLLNKEGDAKPSHPGLLYVAFSCRLQTKPGWNRDAPLSIIGIDWVGRLNLTPSLQGGTPPYPHTWTHMHVITSSLPWVVSYLRFAQQPLWVTKKNALTFCFVPSCLWSLSRCSASGLVRGLECWLFIYLMTQLGSSPCNRCAHSHLRQLFDHFTSDSNDSSNWCMKNTHGSSKSSRYPSVIAPCGAASTWHFVMDSCKPGCVGRRLHRLPTGRAYSTLRTTTRASSVDAQNEGCVIEKVIYVVLLSISTKRVKVGENSCFKSISSFK